jgi:hypothetical protein
LGLLMLVCPEYPTGHLMGARFIVKIRNAVNADLTGVF